MREIMGRRINKKYLLLNKNHFIVKKACYTIYVMTN